MFQILSSIEAERTSPMKPTKTSWKFAFATAGGMFLFATAIHAVSRPVEVVDYVATEVEEMLPGSEGDLPNSSARP